jgi:hypothetical protein
MSRVRSLALAALLAATHSAWAGTTYYVSPQGDDAHDGRGPAPQHALRSLSAAVTKLKPGDTLRVRAGVYRETVVFPTSGTADAPIIVEPFEREAVTVTGLDVLPSAPRGADGRLTLAMPWTLGFGKDQLFWNGKVMREARWPNEPAKGLELPVNDLDPLWPTYGEVSFPRDDAPTSAVVPALDQPEGAWDGAGYIGVHYEGWSQQAAIVKHSKPGALEVERTTHSWWWPPHADYAKEHGRGMLYGVAAALDAPGEWLKQQDAVVVIPPDDAREPVVEAKRRLLAFDFSDRAYVTVRGIKIVAASVRMMESEHCTLQACDLSYTSHFTWFADGRNGHIDAPGDRGPLTRGEVGLFVSGKQNTIRDCDVRVSAGSGAYLEGWGHTLHNNRFIECGYAGTYMVPIYIGGDVSFLSGGHTITFNTIARSGRNSFSVDGAPNQRSGEGAPYDAMTFTNNAVLESMILARDGGSLSAWNVSFGAYDGVASLFRHNVVADCFDREMELGIVYFDNNCWGLDFVDNLVLARPGSIQRKWFFNNPVVASRDEGNRFIENYAGDPLAPAAGDFPPGGAFDVGASRSPLRKLDVDERTSSREVAIGSKEIDLVDGATFRANVGDDSHAWTSVGLTYRFDGQANQNPPFRDPKRSHALTTDPLVLHGEAYDAASAGITTMWNFARLIKDGGEVVYRGVPLGDGYRRLQIAYASSNRAKKWIEIRSGAIDGPVLAKLDLAYADAVDVSPWKGNLLNPYTLLTVDLPETMRGTHDLHFVFRADDGGKDEVAQFSLVRFVDYRGALPLLSDELRLEAHVGAPDGPIVATLHPFNTSGRSRTSLQNCFVPTVLRNRKIVWVVRTEKPAGKMAVDSMLLRRPATFSRK